MLPRHQLASAATWGIRGRKAFWCTAVLHLHRGIVGIFRATPTKISRLVTKTLPIATHTQRC